MVSKNSRLFFLATLGLLVFIGVRPASAFRPFDGTDASVAEPHLFELEFSPVAYSRLGVERFLIAPQITFNYGTGSGFEFVLEGQNVVLMNPDPEGVSPQLEETQFLLKKVLREGVLQEKKGPSIAIEGGVHFPARGQLHAGYGAALILSQPLSATRTMLHFNAELVRTQEQLNEKFLSVILEGPETWPVRPVGELSWEREGEEEAVKGFLAGLIWQAHENVALDVGLQTIDAAGEHGVGLRAGFTWEKQVHEGN